MLEKHMKWGDGFIFIYSLTEKASLSYINTVKDILDKVKGRECPIVLVANKCDLMSRGKSQTKMTMEVVNDFTAQNLKYQ